METTGLQSNGVPPTSVLFLLWQSLVNIVRLDRDSSTDHRLFPL